MVEYKIGEPTELLKKILPLGVQKLVLVAKDELTCTANDGPKIFVGPRWRAADLEKGCRPWISLK